MSAKKIDYMENMEQLKNESNTLWFQLEDMVLLIGTFLLFDPVPFQYMRHDLEQYSILKALLGAPLIKTT